jgi:uncharacterized protein YutE (UPF0331/DUF86 family)
MEEEIKERIIKHLSFLEDEMEDYTRFRELTWELFNKDRDVRRNVERWIENIINASIDIAKLLLTAENIKPGETYRETILKLSLVEGFEKENVREIARWVGLRNILAQEYLDVRWNSIERFISQSEPIFEKFINEVKACLKRKFGEKEESL